MIEYKWLFGVLFSGLGTAIIGTIFLKKQKSDKLSQKQKSGKNSVNFQAGRNIEIEKEGNSNE